MTKVVILAGGRGSRLQELTGETPKPMLEVGGRPILEHIIQRYRVSGFREFVIATGYLGGKVRSWFRRNYTMIEEHENELIVTGKQGEIVHVVDTGMKTLTGGRLLRLKDYLK